MVWFHRASDAIGPGFENRSWIGFDPHQPRFAQQSLGTTQLLGLTELRDERYTDYSVAQFDWPLRARMLISGPK